MRVECEWTDVWDLEPGECASVCEQWATHVSCVPVVGAKTCAVHKCRCAVPIEVDERLAESVRLAKETPPVYLGDFADLVRLQAIEARAIAAVAALSSGTKALESAVHDLRRTIESKGEIR